MSRPRPASQSAAGFTLIEAMASLAILGFFLLGIAWHQMGSVHSVAHARHVSDATNLAQQRLEDMLRLPVASLASGANASNPITETGAAGGIYAQSWTVRTDPRVSSLREVEVAVQWSDKEGSHLVAVRALAGP